MHTKLVCAAHSGASKFHKQLAVMQAPTLVERVKDALEPDIGIATVVNDGSIYLALSTWYVNKQAQISAPRKCQSLLHATLDAKV